MRRHIPKKRLIDVLPQRWVNLSQGTRWLITSAVVAALLLYRELPYAAGFVVVVGVLAWRTLSLRDRW